MAFYIQLFDMEFQPLVEQLSMLTALWNHPGTFVNIHVQHPIPEALIQSSKGMDQTSVFLYDHR